jgi:hypothetical protein
MPSFSRQALYDLVWSEPVKTLAGRFKISDVALAKTCRRAAIPLFARLRNTYTAQVGAFCGSERTA